MDRELQAIVRKGDGRFNHIRDDLLLADTHNLYCVMAALRQLKAITSKLKSQAINQPSFKPAGN